MDRSTVDGKLDKTEKSVFRLEHALIVLEHLPIVLGAALWHGAEVAAQLLAFGVCLVILGMALVWLGARAILK